MTVSFIVRLVDGSTAGGEIVGEVHEVATGARTVVTTSQELIDVLLRPPLPGSDAQRHPVEEGE